MTHSKTKRVLALLGVVAILLLFILTIVFLLLGNSSLAVTFVAINGFITIILFFLLRFHHVAKVDHADMVETHDFDKDDLS